MNYTHKAAAKQSPKPRPKTPRSIRVLEQPTPDTDGWGAIEIAVGREKDTYLVHFVPSEFGVASLGFEVQKLDKGLMDSIDTYHIHLGADPVAQSCDCLGFLRHGRCKHTEGLDALRKAGKLLPFLSAAPATA